MKLDQSLEPFGAAIVSLQHVLQIFNDRGAVIGKAAVGFLGKSRLTPDAD